MDDQINALIFLENVNELLFERSFQTHFSIRIIEK